MIVYEVQIKRLARREDYVGETADESVGWAVGDAGVIENSDPLGIAVVEHSNVRRAVLFDYPMDLRQDRGAHRVEPAVVDRDDNRSDATIVRDQVTPEEGVTKHPPPDPFGTGLVVVDVRTGALLWSFGWPTSSGVNAADPLLVGDRILITSDYGAGATGAPGCQPSPGGQRGQLQAIGAEGSNPAPARPLARRGWVQHVTGFPAWADCYDPKFKGRLVLPSLQNTEGLANLVLAAAFETGKPIDKAQYDIDAGFKKIKTLKPNILTIYTQIPQALNLLEQGEGWAIPSMFSTNVIPKEKESPMKMSAPKEGIFVGPAGVCMVKGGPNPEMAAAFIDMMLGAEMQDKLQPETFAFPSNVAAKPPVGIPADIKVHNLDWGFVAKERGEWVKRWDREMAM